MKEQLLAINNFNKPKEVDNNMAIVLMMVRLVLSPPGYSIMQPKMGIGVNSLWRYVTETRLDELNDEIKQQIVDYMPIEAQGIDCTCSMYKDENNSSINKVLILTAKLDEDIYNIKIDQSGKYEVTYSKLSDLN